MDFEDIAHALWVGMILVLAVLSGKGKRISVLVRKSKPSDKPDVDKAHKQVKTIGKLIKATRRPCNTNPQTSPSHQSRTDVSHTSVKRNFSAYKHLPTQSTAEGNIPDAAVCLTEMKAPFVSVSASPVQRDISEQKTKLREWLTGQVVLDAPAFRKNYGNFFNR